MATSDFPAYIAAEVEHGSEVQEFTPSATAGETAAKAGELMYYDVSDYKIKRCGADPSLIAGICEGASEAWKVLNPNGKIPLRLLKPNAVVAMCSSVALTEAHVGVAYGIVRLASGNWGIDTTDTSATRVIIKKLDTVKNIGFVSFLAGSLQYDAIAS